MKFLQIVTMCSYRQDSEPACMTHVEIVNEVEVIEFLELMENTTKGPLNYKIGDTETFVHHLPDKFKCDTVTLVRIE